MLSFKAFWHNAKLAKKYLMFFKNISNQKIESLLPSAAMEIKLLSLVCLLLQSEYKACLTFS